MAPSPFRVLVPLPLPLPVATTAAAGGLKSWSGAVVTGVVADPDWFWLWLVLTEGTRLSGEVVHFNSMTFRGTTATLEVCFFFFFLCFVCTTINKTIFSYLHPAQHTLTHTGYLPKLLSLAAASFFT